MKPDQLYLTKNERRNRNFLLCFFIFLKLIMHLFLIDKGYDLHRDEYLHLDQAKHLAWGYESVPPFTSWISWIILKLGNGVFWIKFFPALFGALTMVVVWKATEALRGGLFALTLAATATIFSVIMRINILYQPNSFDILCWTFIYFSLLKYIISDKKIWLYWVAISVAIGILNKYNIAFLVLGLIPALLITSQRKVFLDKHLYFAAGLALLLILPNLLWQINNNFPVVHHMKQLAATQLVHVNRGDFLKEQLLYFSGALFILIAAFVAFVFYKPYKAYRFLGWAYIFTIVIFVYFKAKGYYAIGLYPIFLAFGSAYLEKLLSKGWKYYVRPVAFALVVIVFIPFFKIAFPLDAPAYIATHSSFSKKLGLLRWEDGKEHMLPQDYADMLGWHELAHKVDSVFAAVNDSNHTLVLCDNYGEAGAINYYSTLKTFEAVSMNADYINWFPLATKQITNIIRIKEKEDEPSDDERDRNIFDTVTLVDSVQNQFARERGTRIYLLYNSAGPVNKILEQEIIAQKIKN